MWGSAKLRKRFAAATALRLELLQFLARLKAHDPARRNHHFFAGAWIASHSGFAGAHGKNSEAAQLDAIAAAHRVLQRLDDSLHRVFGPGVAHARCGHDGFYDVNLDHAASGIPSASLC